MQLGMIGLGRMGANMVRRLINKGHSCVVFDRSPQAVSELVTDKATGTSWLACKIRYSGGYLANKSIHRTGNFGQDLGPFRQMSFAIFGEGVNPACRSGCIRVPIGNNVSVVLQTAECTIQDGFLDFTIGKCMLG